MNTPQSALDPRQANASFRHEPFGDYPDGEYNIGRVYYWYDADRKHPQLSDEEFRAQHPEIDDEEWHRLFCCAFNRGETEFASALCIEPSSKDRRRAEPGDSATKERP